MSRPRTSPAFPAASLWIALAALALTATPSGAAVVVTDASVFVVAIDANDAVSIDCSGGFVRVTDDGTPTTYTTACSAVTSLSVTATGAFDNTIDLSGVTAAAFTAAPTVTIVSGAGIDTLTGSGLNDTITGGPGNETQLGGGGNDTFIWNPGDGSDTLVGGAGTDTMLFNGSAGNEIFAVSADGTGFDFTRDLGNIVMDAEQIETLTLNGLGGNDTATVGNLTGVADLTAIQLSMGDGDDTVNASAQANTAIALTIDGGIGNDNLTGSAAADTINGNAGNDTIVGLGGIDILLGADGDDTITGGPGNETQEGGGGNDTFIWNPGDGSDNLLGGAGTDTMVFNGSAGNEVFAVVQEGTGFDFTRDLGNILMDADQVEAITLNALGGDDRVTTVPLPGTSQNLFGGAQTTADVLVIDALGGCVLPATAGTISIAGGQPIVHAEFEQVTVQGGCVADVPTLGPLAMALLALLLVGAAFLAIRLQGSS